MRVLLLVVGLVLASARPAGADPQWRQLVDGGAVPFFWLPLAGRLVYDELGDPRPEPLGFDAREGGEPAAAWDIPAWAVVASVAALGAGLATDDDDARWFHLKGFAESYAMTSLVTTLAKNGFGRHRPDYDPQGDLRDGRRSFPSGHASASAAAVTYLALYLADHGDSRAADAAIAGGLALAHVGLCIERVVHERHHTSDVLVGSLLGAAISVAFYYWQESRAE